MAESARASADALRPYVPDRLEAGEPASVPMVGREREMAVLRDAIEDARRGRGRFVEIVGEPGIGKSRLVEEIRGVAQGFTAWATASELYESSTPYFAFRRPLHEAIGIAADDGDAKAIRKLRDAVRRVAPELESWIPLLAMPFGLDVPDTAETRVVDERFRRAKSDEVTGDLLARVLTGPTLLTIEDVHWMDEASAGLLRSLIPRIQHAPWLIMATRRDVQTGLTLEGLDEVETLRPAPLDARAAAAMLAAATDDAPLAPHEIAALAERAGGNPFFLRELLRAARASGGVEELPESVEALVMEQIDRLDTPHKTLLRFVAVLGQTFTEGLAQEVFAQEFPDPLAPASAALSGFITRDEEGNLRFDHALIRDAAYEGLPYRRRQALHARVGTTLEGKAADPEDAAELLSFHFLHSAAFEKAWRYSVIAGDRAKSLNANIEAAEFFRRAVEAGRRSQASEEELAETYVKMGDAREALGEYEAAASAYRAARRLRPGDAVFTAQMFLKEGRVQELAFGYPQAVRTYRRGMRTLEGAGHAEALRRRADLLLAQGAARQAQGKHREALDCYTEAAHAAEEAGARDVLAHAAYLLDWVYMEIGKADQAPYPGLALEIYESLDDLLGLSNVYGNSGMFAYFEGRWDDARTWYERDRETCERMGDIVRGTVASANIAEILADQGHYELAEERLREALAIHRAAGHREMVSFERATLGRLRSRAGWEGAEELLREAREESRATGIDRQVLEADARIAEFLLLRGMTGAAEALASQTLAGAEATGGMALIATMLRRILGYAAVQSGDLSAARGFFEAGLREARERKAAYEVALTLEALARLDRIEGDVEAAKGHETEYRTLFERLGVVRTPEVPLRVPLSVSGFGDATGA